MLAWLLPLLVFTGCWKPRDTGPHSMVGVLVDAQGKPLSDVTIDTVEARWVTDDAGHFAVNYKEPSQFLTFTVRGIRYQRAYRPADDGQVVTVKLPELGPMLVSCDADETCDAQLTWELGDGLTATIPTRCDREEVQSVSAAPKTAPTSATCRVSPTSDEVPLVGTRLPRGVRLTPPPVAVTVSMSTQDAEPPQRCFVAVNGRALDIGNDGQYHTKDFGYVGANAVCDGIPAMPVYVYLRTPAELDLVWTRTTPSLDLQPYMPWTQDLIIAQIEGRGRGWTQTLTPMEDGTYRLPPLNKGTYAIAANFEPDRILQSSPVAELAPGTLHIRALSPEMWMGPGPEALGMLFVDAPLTDGSIDVMFYEGDE